MDREIERIKNREEQAMSDLEKRLEAAEREVARLSAPLGDQPSDMKEWADWATRRILEAERETQLLREKAVQLAMEKQDEIFKLKHEAQALCEERDRAVADEREANQTATRAIINLAARDQEIKTLREERDSLHRAVEILEDESAACEQEIKTLDRMTKDRDGWRDAAQKELDRANEYGRTLAAKDRLLSKMTTERDDYRAGATAEAMAGDEARAKVAEQAEIISQARVGVELALMKKPGITFPDAEVETLMRRAYEMLGGQS